MKTSKKILIIGLGLFIALMAISLFILRNDLQSSVEKNKSKNKFKSIAVGNFKNLDFSSNWDVYISTGIAYKVELKTQEATSLKSKLENIGGTLYFKIDSIPENKKDSILGARITVPSLRAIKITGNTKIHLESFQSDSLNVIMENNSKLTGYNNNFKYFFLKTSGKASCQFTKDE